MRYMTEVIRGLWLYLYAMPAARSEGGERS